MALGCSFINGRQLEFEVSVDTNVEAMLGDYIDEWN